MPRGLRIALSIGIGIVALVYGVSPVDLIPEFPLGPIGFIDDAAVWVGAGLAIWKLLTGGRGPKLGPEQGPQGPGNTEPFEQV